MKKIKLKIIILALFIILPLDVSAGVNPVIDYQSGVYSNRVSNGVTYYGQLGYIYVNNRITYCVKPLDLIGSNYQVVNKFSNLTDEQIKYFELVSHFGYNYSNHNSIYYYMATQELIWEHIYGINDVYWTTESGTKGNIINIDIYKNEISDLISLAYIMPMFNTNAVVGSVGDVFEIIDNNNVLKNFKISSVGNNKVWIQNNSLFIKIEDYSNFDIVLIREENDYFESKYFASSGGQDLSQFGLNYKLTKAISVLVNPYTSGLFIGVFENGYPVRGKTTFKIYNIDTSQFFNYDGTDIFETDDNGKFLSDFKLGEGHYKIINVEIPFGYTYGRDMLFEISRYDNLSDSRYRMVDIIELSKGNLKINTFYNVDNQNVKVNDLVYKIYADKDVLYNGVVFFPKDSLVAVSNKDEVDTKFLPGYYYVMVYNKDGELMSNTHYQVDLLYIDAYSDINKSLNIELDNNLSNFNLNVKEEGNEISYLKDMKYGIYALEDVYFNNNLLFKKNELIEELITDTNGNDYTNLLYGKYYIRELYNLDKYNITNDQYIEVDKDNSNINLNIIKTLKAISDEEVVDKKTEIESNSIKEELPNTSNYNLKYYIIFISVIVLGIFGLLNEKKN